jgi:hypothetical protein
MERLRRPNDETITDTVEKRGAKEARGEEASTYDSSSKYHKTRAHCVVNMRRATRKPRDNMTRAL